MTTNNDTSVYRVCQWIDSAVTRFKNMYDAGIDTEGWPNIQKMLAHIEQHKCITVGQAQYIFNRTHPMGAVPKYNTHKKYHQSYGNMLECNIKDLIDSDLVDWSSGRGCMQPNFAAAIKKETDWEYRMGRLVKKRITTALTFDQLFKR